MKRDNMTLPDLSQFSKELRDEIAYRADLIQESIDDDDWDGATEGESLLLLIFDDIERSDFWKDFRLEILRWGIHKGYWRLVSQAEFDSAVVIGGKRAKERSYEKVDGERYEWIGPRS